MIRAAPIHRAALVPHYLQVKLQKNSAAQALRESSIQSPAIPEQEVQMTVQ